jgi:hypothetical protein
MRHEGKQVRVLKLHVRSHQCSMLLGARKSLFKSSLVPGKAQISLAFRPVKHTLGGPMREYSFHGEGTALLRNPVQLPASREGMGDMTYRPDGPGQ